MPNSGLYGGFLEVIALLACLDASAGVIRPGFMLVRRLGGVELKTYGRRPGSAARFTSWHRNKSGMAVLLGRLLYHHDLVRRLGIPASEAADPDGGTNDAALVLAAYERWGTDALRLLEGDFAAAVYDAREDSLFGFRDNLGGYPLYYAGVHGVRAVGTAIGPLVSLLPCAAVNAEGVAAYLSLRTFGFQQPDDDASMYAGVRRARVGHFVRLGADDAVEHRAYWDWRDAVDENSVPERRPEAIHEHFSVLLREAVRERCVGVTAAQMSGGMDSTSVAMLAAQELANRAPVHAISMIYRKWRALALERRFVTEALASCPALVPHLIEADELHDYGCFENPPSTDEPWPSLYRAGAEAAMYDVAAAVGAVSMLTGAGGDEIAAPPAFDVADRLREWRPRLAWQTAAQVAAGQGRNLWSVFLPYGVLPLVPAPLRGKPRTLFRRGRAAWDDLDDIWIPPWIRPEFARQHDLFGRAVQEMRRAASFAHSLQLSWSLYMIVSRGGDMMRWYLGSPRGIHTGNPLLDPRVFRYGLVARAKLPPSPGRQKPLLADAMRAVLPEAIRTRRHKGDFSEAYYIGLAHHADELDAMVRESPADDLGFLDRRELLRCLGEHRMARAANERAGGRMSIVLAILVWLSHQEEWIRAVPTPSEDLRWPSGPRVDAAGAPT